MKKIMNRSLTVLGLAGVASLGIFTPAFGTKPPLQQIQIIIGN